MLSRKDYIKWKLLGLEAFPRATPQEEMCRYKGQPINETISPRWPHGNFIYSEELYCCRPKNHNGPHVLYNYGDGYTLYTPGWQEHDYPITVLE